MKIGLINIEPKIVNTALMQISQRHKQLGDDVEWAIPLEYGKYDYLFCSSLFTFTDKSTVPHGAICGGTGFDVLSSFDGEDIDYDYSIYPDCDYSIVWLSRGCTGTKKSCPFCVVPLKEGKIRAVKPKNLNPKGKHIVVQDNNLFANPQWDDAIMWLNEQNQPVELQGIDTRVMNDEKFKALASISLCADQAIKIAWDNPEKKISQKFKQKITTMLKYIKPAKIMCYVLIDYWSTPEQDLYRVRTLWDLYGVRPYVMSYNEKDPDQKAFERWVNGHFYKNTPWSEYKYNPNRGHL